MNAFVTKEIIKIPRYHILLNVLQLLIVGIVVAECVIDTLSLCLLVQFFLPLSLQYIPPYMYHRLRHNKATYKNDIHTTYINVVMNGKMFSFDGFLGFRKSFCGIEKAF